MLPCSTSSRVTDLPPSCAREPGQGVGGSGLMGGGDVGNSGAAGWGKGGEGAEVY